MDKALAMLILGMGLTGAILMISVAELFNTPISNGLKIITISSLTAFIIFAISSFRLRKRLKDENE